MCCTWYGAIYSNLFGQKHWKQVFDIVNLLFCLCLASGAFLRGNNFYKFKIGTLLVGVLCFAIYHCFKNIVPFWCSNFAQLVPKNNLLTVLSQPTLFALPLKTLPRQMGAIASFWQAWKNIVFFCRPTTNN